MQPTTKEELIHILSSYFDAIVIEVNKTIANHVPGNPTGPICLNAVLRTAHGFMSEYYKTVKDSNRKSNPATANILDDEREALTVATLIYKVMLFKEQTAKRPEEGPFYEIPLSPEQEADIELWMAQHGYMPPPPPGFN